MSANFNSRNMFPHASGSLPLQCKRRDSRIGHALMCRHRSLPISAFNNTWQLRILSGTGRYDKAFCHHNHLNSSHKLVVYNLHGTIGSLMVMQAFSRTR
eukprot:3258058-Pleurochrysis_carterae.AAC.1